MSTNQAAPGAEHAADLAPPRALSTRELGLLFAVLYSDLFEYPLTLEEMRRFSVSRVDNEGELREAAERLLEAELGERDGYVFLAGRDRVVDLRRERRDSARQLWPEAHRCARFLRHVPFLCMVAVCGSLAVENADENGDIDLFCVTTSGRLWIAQSVTMVLRRLFALTALLRGRRLKICPNFFLTLERLELDERNLYTAHEVAQVVPLWGHDVHRDFLSHNRWLRDLLPNLEHEPRAGSSLAGFPTLDTDTDIGIESGTEPDVASRPLLTRFVERCLGGWLGDRLDRLVFETLVRYYAWRLKRHGIAPATVRSSYRRDRQHVVGEGYRPTVARRFRELAAERLGGQLDSSLPDRLFPPDTQVTPVDLYREKFEESYGVGGG